MRIVIVGYGKMGKAIKQEAEQLSIPVSKIINNRAEIKDYDFSKDELAIEFTEPTACVENIKILSKKGVSVVCGTTGWYEKFSEIEEVIKKYNTGFLYAENFSIGVNSFYHIIEEASKIFNDIPYYDMMIYEAHHKNKKDSPSGTAKKVAEIICHNVQRKTKLAVGNINRALSPDEIHISSARCGNVIGEHKVVFDSEYDTIEISHLSKGRRGYALGAIRCAQWLHGKKGVFSMNEYMQSYDKI